MMIVRLNIANTVFMMMKVDVEVEVQGILIKLCMKVDTVEPIIIDNTRRILVPQDMCFM